ncbi:efflux RND transporter periplasmic adaptor subunit [Clostridium sp. HBUAS56017]|uniref:biotin/lipoyl-binding protein n=1 Tax=Clostridium sp. HBUAS56017 TaxID=2571128 RepID=UPI001177AF84|nr:efflux RND transporter periplasmic adaptor subunit [Clostridium sp. HBUAS56017]
MKKKYLYIILFIIVIILTITSLYFIKLSKHSKSNMNKMDTYTIPTTEKVYIDGIITPELSKDYYIDSSKGTLNEIFVTDGQIVKKGDVLYKYKNEQISDQIEQLQNKLKEIESGNEQYTENNINSINNKTENNSNLLENNLITNSNKNINQMKKQINLLKSKEYSEVVSDFEGKIYIYENSYNKSENNPILNLMTNTFCIKGKISEKDKPKINIDINKTVDVFIISLNKSVSGKIKDISNKPSSKDFNTTSNSTTQTNISYYDITILPESQEFLDDGFHIQATYKMSNNSIKVPNTSILKDGDISYVYKVVDKKIEKQIITLKEYDSDYAILEDGLNENDTIIKNADTTLKEGQLIE